MKLTMWLKERELNARRIAAGKTNEDRPGWLEDADYFQGAREAVRERDTMRAALFQAQEAAKSIAGAHDRLSVALIDCARRCEALKRPCGMDPESAQAVRNGEYMSIAMVARAALGPNVAIKRPVLGSA